MYRHAMSPLVALVCLTGSAAADHMEFLRVAADGKSFEFVDSGRRFTPWGFNYDHDGTGRLIEDYWHTDWPRIVEDFGEMKRLGANVVRIHLQFGKFMEAPDRPARAELKQLQRLLALAEKTGLYLDLTGLGCYHKKDVPDWYDRLDEAGRWRAQAQFWRTIAQTCRDSPAVFCYDLMNEPVVAGKNKRSDWLGPSFGGKHFVQFITLQVGDRPRPLVARQWIEHLVAAVRAVDDRHLITVGLVPWSLDRPGLTSGFVPEKVADRLDFISVHIYPERGKIDQAIDTLRGFAIGKPVVIEEVFPLKCSTLELEKFLDASRDVACGWIGFYWGKTPEELRRSKTIRDAIALSWLELFQRLGPRFKR